MEKRAIVAIGLSFLILLGWYWLFPPPPPQNEPAATPPPAIAEEMPRPDLREAGGPQETPAPAPEQEPVQTIEAVAAEEVRIGTELFDVVLTNEGGRATSWKLKEYLSQSDEPLDLVPHFEDGGLYPLAVDLDDPGLTEAINGALFQVERTSLPSRDATGEGERITFTWADGTGLEVRKVFTFRQNDWLVDVELDVIDRGRRLPARLTVGPGFAAQESTEGKSTYYYAGQGVWNVAGSVTRRKPKKLVAEDGAVSGDVIWAGLEDQYFAALVLPRQRPAKAQWRSVELTAAANDWDEPSDEPVEALRQPVLSVSVDAEGAQLFIGPKKYRMLRELGSELEKSVWFATNGFLAAISKYIFLALLWIHDHVPPHNYGLSIILATCVLRILLFPVNQYAMVSMKKTQMQMQRLQPKIKSIKAKYAKHKDAKSRQKMNEETMAMYKKEGVNPMGGVSGCLPLLAQFPILIGFYNMLTVAVELRGAPFFGWIQDLSQKDPLWVIPLMMGVTMFVQQKMAMSKVTDPMQQQQQKIMMFMPIFFTWICLQMPSGMVLYWFVNNALGIGQQWLVNRHTGKLQAATQKA